MLLLNRFKDLRVTTQIFRVNFSCETGFTYEPIQPFYRYGELAIAMEELKKLNDDYNTFVFELNKVGDYLTKLGYKRESEFVFKKLINGFTAFIEIGKNVTYHMSYRLKNNALWTEAHRELRQDAKKLEHFIYEN